MRASRRSARATPMLEKIEERLAHRSLTGDDARAMTEIVSDALILVSPLSANDHTNWRARLTLRAPSRSMSEASSRGSWS